MRLKDRLLQLLGGLALGASMLFLASIAAFAADLGGNCCQDLEERVSELEAVSARKGNRKVSVTIDGQVSRALLFVDTGGGDWQKNVVDNSAAPTRFGFSGVGRINSAATVGYRIELEVTSRPAIPNVDPHVFLRHSYLWLEHKDAGRLSLGHTSMATDGIVAISTANVEVASRMLSLAPLSTAYLFGLDLPFNNLRRDLVRYDTPVWGGFTASASWANGDSAAGFSSKHAWDFAIRYAHEIKEGGGFKVAAGLGYSDQDNAIDLLPNTPVGLTRDKMLSGSASVMHMTSGLFVSAAAGDVRQETLFGGADWRAYHTQAGWQRNVFGVGATTLYGEWAQLRVEGLGATPWAWGFGAVQAIDAAALDVYAAFRSYELDAPGAPEIRSVMVGARVRF